MSRTNVALVTSTDPGRRRLLIVGSSTVVGAVALGVGLVLTRSDGEPEGGGPRATTTTPTSRPPASTPVEAVSLVGAAYRRDHPDEDDAGTLRSLLPTLTATTAAGLLEELELLSPQVTAEFEADDTVLLDGWILARAEARGAALVSLTP